MTKKNKIQEEKTKKTLLYISFFIIGFFIGILIILKSLGQTVHNYEWLYSYDINRELTYKVNLKDNVFYDTKTLGMNEQYVSELVKSIDVTYNYGFTATIPASIEYKYKIIGTLCIKYAGSTSNSDSDIIWSKEYELLPEETQKLEGTELKINRDLSLNYDEYQQEVNRFKENFATPINAYLDLKLMISTATDFKNVEKPVIADRNIQMIIPLNQEVFSITENYDKKGGKSVYENELVEKPSNKKMIIVGSIILSISLMGIIGVIEKTIKQGKKSDYMVALNKILRSYGDIVVEVVSPIDIEDDVKIVNVKDFEQMLDIEEEIRMPILFYETIQGKQGEFVILYDNMVYKYIIGD